MEEDSIPQSPGPDVSGKTTSNIQFKTPEGTKFDISSECGKLGNNVMIGTGHVMVINKTSDNRKRYKAKKPLTENQEEPKPDLLRNIAEKILLEEAFMLGRILKLTDAKIDEIKVDHNVAGAAEIKYQILVEWCKKDENPTIKTIALALSKIERGDISDKLLI